MRNTYATETWKPDRVTGFEGILFFTREDADSLYLVHRQLLKLVGACSGERTGRSDTTVVVSVHWLTGAPFEASLSPWHVVALHQDGKS